MHTDLKTYLEQAEGRIVVLHGESTAAIQAILSAFMLNGVCHYYRARPASEREQLYQLKNELLFARKLPAYPGWEEILAAVFEESSGKQILILDEYHYIEKSSPQFIETLADVVDKYADSSEVSAVLVSSHVGWVKHGLMAKVQARPGLGVTFMAVGEQSFFELYAQYGAHSFTGALESYAILGGDPGLWCHFDKKLSSQQNICRNILAPAAYLHSHGERVLGLELREVGIYATILAAIAAGRHTLAQIHAHTGFSRAKISVYLKNLMELGLVEKTAGYEIVNHFVHFHFQYLYPHYSDLARISANEFYKKHIAPTFKSYVSSYFKKVCMAWMAEQIGEMAFIHKPDTQALDIVGSGPKGQTYIAQCNNEKPLMTYDDYEWLLFCAKEADISPDHIYLFSIGHFDERLSLEAKVRKNIHLVGAKELEQKKPIYR